MSFVEHIYISTVGRISECNCLALRMPLINSVLVDSTQQFADLQLYQLTLMLAVFRELQFFAPHFCQHLVLSVLKFKPFCLQCSVSVWFYLLFLLTNETEQLFRCSLDFLTSLL